MGFARLQFGTTDGNAIPGRAQGLADEGDRSPDHRKDQDFVRVQNAVRLDDEPRGGNGGKAGGEQSGCKAGHGSNEQDRQNEEREDRPVRQPALHQQPHGKYERHGGSGQNKGREAGHPPARKAAVQPFAHAHRQTGLHRINHSEGLHPLPECRHPRVAAAGRGASIKLSLEDKLRYDNY